MKLVGRLLLSAALVLLSATFGYSEDLYYGGYDGMWQGSLKIHGLDLTTFDETQKSSSEMDFRLQIKGATVRVAFFATKSYISRQLAGTQQR